MQNFYKVSLSPLWNPVPRNTAGPTGPHSYYIQHNTFNRRETLTSLEWQDWQLSCCENLCCNTYACGREISSSRGIKFWRLCCSVLRRFHVLFEYTPRHIDELHINAGDVVQVMEKCDDGWYVGTSERTGEFGTFPGNYVEPVAAQWRRIGENSLSCSSITEVAVSPPSHLRKSVLLPQDGCRHTIIERYRWIDRAITAVVLPRGVYCIQGDHFPDMKFPDFSLTFPVEASKDYPVSSVYRYGQQ